ncbi:hypothetical protein GUJ93_ZPchr0006g42780 [Zizania palustris]|uniref:Uncharacterized protein n=1 Tax=Zizania palustris TaxID=103762 RepID=A0A8J5SUS6_ZIZPA|nr:hypothetical protein GUJ93_ZPchr0006g42780 [Zizania palustris]
MVATALLTPSRRTRRRLTAVRHFAVLRSRLWPLTCLRPTIYPRSAARRIRPLVRDDSNGALCGYRLWSPAARRVL